LDDKAQLYQPGAFPLTLLYEYYQELALCDILICSALSLYLYLNSFAGTSKILADGGDSGNPIYDFFIGRELNPRIGSFDWKEFCELRPGLIGWMLLNLACAKQQQNELGYISGSMMLLCLFQGVYVWDALYQERAILTTMDITTDGFGFMLLFGDLAWVPFTYSVQARYLVKHDPHLSPMALAIILALHVAGYIIFRGANGQKDAFRRNPNDPALKHLSFLQTKRGTKLLTSGWWGLARKINYTGDYLMGLTWCLVCGFQSIVPYFYAVYFLILLIHRSIRDDHMCHVKYGDDWLDYKKQVPYRFIPGVV
jgi:Delta14-sterol reductase